MGAHNNIHIPEESWPRWIWFAIEFGMVLAASMLISRELVNMFPDLGPELQNWVFFGFVAGMFIVWYMIIRALVFKRPILGNRYAS